MTMRDRPRVVFLGTHGQYNIGDELLLETFLHHLGPDAHYIINTYDKEFTATQLGDRYSYDLVDTAGDRLRLLWHLLRADRVVFGGGSIIKELYTTVGRNRYATLAMILAIVTFARWVARRPVAMLNIGVGPLTTKMGRRLARLVLRQVDLVTVRDPGSWERCRSLGVDARLATDAVFSADPEWLLGGPPPPKPTRGRRRLALNLNYDIANPDNWHHFTARLAEVLDGLGGSVEIHTLPMQCGFKDHDDAAVLDAFAARLPGVTVVHHRPTTHQEAAKLIASCDLLVSERLHAIVMAAVLGVPVFALAYDVKVTELASLLGLDEATVDINQPFTTAELEEPLRRLLSDLEGAGTRLAAATARLRHQAQGSFAAAADWLGKLQPSQLHENI
jgi:polysaccharide pyruvyl transferase CsaB